MDSTLNYEAVHIEMTEDTPLIILNMDENILKIEGPSYPEDAYGLYERVIEWVTKLKKHTISELNCNFNFKVLSSASHKMIYEILIELESLHKISNSVTINWYFLNFDEDMHETGEDFAETIDLPFKFFPLESQ